MQRSSSCTIRSTLRPLHHNSSERTLRRPVESAQYTSLAFGNRCKDAGQALDRLRRRRLRQCHV
ncbi:hypothetical protein CHELA1G2_21162 [Hyphomicrobiales bacterium]|nr:hypothetical protein CHELA1G2_21162 [Hyphomicrobiales bacterium]